MKIILDDTIAKNKLYPFTATRHTADIRIGILTIREKWNYNSGFQLYDSHAALNEDSLVTDKNFVTELESNLIPTREWLYNLITQKENNVIDKSESDQL